MSNSLHIVCPHCNATNRVPSTKSMNDAQCGRCHKTLFEGKPAELDEVGFDAQISKSDVKVNTEVQQSLAARFTIRSIPTLAIFLDGNELARQAGAYSEADMTKWIESVI
jgi:thioredoxin 2